MSRPANAAIPKVLTEEEKKRHIDRIAADRKQYGSDEVSDAFYNYIKEQFQYIHLTTDDPTDKGKPIESTFLVKLKGSFAKDKVEITDLTSKDASFKLDDASPHSIVSILPALTQTDVLYEKALEKSLQDVVKHNLLRQGESINFVAEYQPFGGQGHWGASNIVMTLNADGNIIVAAYGHDPMAPNSVLIQDFRNKIELSFRKVYSGKTINFQYPPSPAAKPPQIGGLGCGVYTVEALSNLVTKAPNQAWEGIAAGSEPALRQKHAELFAKYNPSKLPNYAVIAADATAEGQSAFTSAATAKAKIRLVKQPEFIALSQINDLELLRQIIAIFNDSNAIVNLGGKGQGDRAEAARCYRSKIVDAAGIVINNDLFKYLLKPNQDLLFPFGDEIDVALEVAKERIAVLERAPVKEAIPQPTPPLAQDDKAPLPEKEKELEEGLDDELREGVLPKVDKRKIKVATSSDPKSAKADPKLLARGGKKKKQDQEPMSDKKSKKKREAVLDRANSYQVSDGEEVVLDTIKKKDKKSKKGAPAVSLEEDLKADAPRLEPKDDERVDDEVAATEAVAEASPTTSAVSEVLLTKKLEVLKDERGGYSQEKQSFASALEESFKKESEADEEDKKKYKDQATLLYNQLYEESLKEKKLIRELKAAEADQKREGVSAKDAEEAKKTAESLEGQLAKIKAEKKIPDGNQIYISKQDFGGKEAIIDEEKSIKYAKYLNLAGVEVNANVFAKGADLFMANFTGSKLGSDSAPLDLTECINLSSVNFNKCSGVVKFPEGFVPKAFNFRNCPDLKVMVGDKEVTEFRAFGSSRMITKEDIYKTPSTSFIPKGATRIDISKERLR